jgi:hypothetical protein
MLMSIESGAAITRIPHRQQWDAWRARLTDAQWSAIRAELISHIATGDLHTAGWIPGTDWAQTPFQPICEDACLGNKDAAALCFGLAVWVVMMEHEGIWGFGRYNLNDAPIRSMTYFRIP